MKYSRPVLFMMILLVMLACNLPASSGTAVPELTPLTGPGIQITSPIAGAQLLADKPVTIFYLAAGGPFIEVDLKVDGQIVTSQVINVQDTSITGSLDWSNPIDGLHIIELQAVTAQKNIYQASVQIVVAGAGVPATTGAPVITPTFDPAQETARQRVIQILHDQYGLNMSAPPVGHKIRYGVTTDPWTSAVYFGDWLISISLYPDRSEDVKAYPVNHADPNANPNFIKPDDKSGFTHVCRPSGTIKLLAVFVDYQNLGVTQAEALDALNQAVTQINGKYAEASRAVGVQTPILQIQATGAYLVAPTLNQNHLLTPQIVHATTGYDVSQFDILTQIDLDANNTYAKATNFGSFGFAWGGCGELPLDVNMWIGLTAKDQLYEGSDARLRSTLGHEILHDMGYPIGKTGVHEWICGDGTTVDATDQCDQNNLPTYIMGWTDTDGDGVVEILDPTPYGYLPP